MHTITYNQPFGDGSNRGAVRALGQEAGTRSFTFIMGSNAPQDQRKCLLYTSSSPVSGAQMNPCCPLKLLGGTSYTVTVPSRLLLHHNSTRGRCSPTFPLVTVASSLALSTDIHWLSVLTMILTACGPSADVTLLCLAAHFISEWVTNDKKHHILERN